MCLYERRSNPLFNVENIKPPRLSKIHEARTQTQTQTAAVKKHKIGTLSEGKVCVQTKHTEKFSHSAKNLYFHENHAWEAKAARMTYLGRPPFLRCHSFLFRIFFLLYAINS